MQAKKYYLLLSTKLPFFLKFSLLNRLYFETPLLVRDAKLALKHTAAPSGRAAPAGRASQAQAHMLKDPPSDKETSPGREWGITIQFLVLK